MSLFVNIDPEQIMPQLVSDFEGYLGITLAAGDQRRQFLQGFGYVFMTLLQSIEATGEANLLEYSAGAQLDKLGALVGVTRLPADYADVTMQFTLSNAQNQAVTIPQGTRVTPDGVIFFATTAALTIPSGQPDEILDELAWQFNALEYDPSLPRSTKVQLVESAILNNKQRGTVAAVERIATQIFGDAWIEEWFNYSGEPYHFKVHTSNVSVGDQEAAQFAAVIASAQNVRSVLESVIVETVEQMNLNFGGVIHTADVIYM